MIFTERTTLFFLLLLPLAITAILSPNIDSKPLITTYAALGDSYAAGSGAGSPILPLHCSLFSGAYPVLIANSRRLSIDGPAGGFRNLACGGALTNTVLATQSPRIGDADIVTLTVGGNEVDFFPLLDACVYQWHLPLRTGCEEQLQRSRELVQSDRLIRDFEAAVQSIARRLKTGARLLVTGYAAFFNEESDQCDGASFSRTDPSNLMTKELRRRLNGEVRLLNNVIRATAEAVEGVEYVDIDRLFEGNRFCEEGVTEPDPGSEETWFFGLGDQHDRRHGRDKGPEQQAVNSRPIEDFLNLGKVFHPTLSGHEAIANAVVNQILQT